MKNVIINFSNITHLKQLGFLRPFIALLIYCVLLIFLKEIVLGAPINVFWGALVFGSCFYFPPLYFIYIVSIHLFRSYKTLVFSFFILSLFWFHIATHSQGTVYSAGYLIISEGKITTIGLLLNLIHPYVLLSLLSLFVWAVNFLNLKIKKEK